MSTLDFYTVYKWESWEGDEVIGHYQRKSDAEYVRDHAEALEIKGFVESFPPGKRDAGSKCVHWLGREVGFEVSEEELYLA